jgi:hypothetical protein
MGASSTDGARSGLSIFDPLFNGMPRSEMYRAQSFPELFPNEQAMRVQQWPAEDREAYCGGIYTPGYAEMKNKKEAA